MKILFVPPAHAKIHRNMSRGFEKLNIDVSYKSNPSDHDIESSDVVYSACRPFPIQKYPNTKFVFGPNFSIFPDSKSQFDNINKNAVYVQPSDWAKQVWLDLGYKSLPLYTYPVGVDTDLFSPTKPIEERDKMFIYYKYRLPSELQQLKDLFPEAKVFTYGSYSETEYLDYLRDAKFGIWLSAHESEGFALLEALSCDVPLLVWSATKMSQAFGYSDLFEKVTTPATTVPYWNACCGEVFTDGQDLLSSKERFLSNLLNYTPRKYILENLTLEKTTENFISMCEMIPNLTE